MEYSRITTVHSQKHGAAASGNPSAGGLNIVELSQIGERVVQETIDYM